MLSYSSVQQEVKRQRAVLNARGFVQLCCDPGDKMQPGLGEARVALQVSPPPNIAWSACCVTESTPWPVPTPCRPRSACPTV